MPRDFAANLIAAVQDRLADLGWYRLKVDGVFGPGTSNAVIRFKEAHGLWARDFVGPITLDLLFSDRAKPHVVAPVAGEPLWLTEAKSLLGTKEVPGTRNNPDIMGWAKGLDQWYPGDDTAWCGLFVAHCMAAGAPDAPQDFNRLGAREWLKFGEAASTAVPPLGSVCILWRTHPTQSWHGHVFLVTGRSGSALRGIGGNQSNSVREDWFSRDRVLGVRVPGGYEGPVAPEARKGALSVSEA